MVLILVKPKTKYHDQILELIKIPDYLGINWEFLGIPLFLFR